MEKENKPKYKLYYYLKDFIDTEFLLGEQASLPFSEGTEFDELPEALKSLRAIKSTIEIPFLVELETGNIITR